MESRRMVLVNLFAGSNGDADIENRLVDTVGKEMVGQMKRVTWKHICCCCCICKIESQWAFAVGLRKL